MWRELGRCIDMTDLVFSIGQRTRGVPGSEFANPTHRLFCMWLQPIEWGVMGWVCGIVQGCHLTPHIVKIVRTQEYLSRLMKQTVA